MNKCMYCNKLAKVKGFCKTDYTFLKRNNISFKNPKKCILELKKRDTRKKLINKNNHCKYCQEKVYAHGYCNRDYKFLKYHNIPFDNTKLCLEKLFIRDARMNKKCIHCGDVHHGNDFCRSCYMYLYRRNIDMDDKALCLKLLNEEHHRIKFF